MIFNSLILWANLNYRETYYQFLFFHFLTRTNPTILLDAMLEAVILHLSFLDALRCLYLLRQATGITSLIVSGSQ